MGSQRSYPRWLAFSVVAALVATITLGTAHLYAHSGGDSHTASGCAACGAARSPAIATAQFAPPVAEEGVFLAATLGACEPQLVAIAPSPARAPPHALS